MEQAVSEIGETNGLRTVLVDLTPVLPGGENGGAKVFVLELLRRLAELAPETQFVLLTRASAHEELAALDSANVRRLMIGDANGRRAAGLPGRLLLLGSRIYSRVLAHLPPRLGRLAGRIGYQLLASSTRGASRSLLRDVETDLLFCPFTAPTYFKMGIPTVSVIYDLQYKTYPEFFAPAEVAHRDRTFVEAARRSTTLVAISDYSRDSAIAKGGVDPCQIKTIHLQVSQHSMRNAARDDSILERLQVAPGRYIIYPANFWKHKNHEMLLSAFALARRRGLADDVRLVCTGAPGDRRDWLMQAARGLGLEDRILFPGYLGNAQLLSLMSNCAGVVFPSLYEGFGLPVVEAMATGVPIACSNVTSLPEVAGDAAILFDPRKPEQIAQAMISLAHDKQLTERLVLAGEIRVSQFLNSKLMAEQYWETFRQAVRQSFQSNALIGVYTDGWMAPELKLCILPATGDRTLNLEIFHPAGAPTREVTLKMQHDQAGDVEISVLRGKSGVVSVALPSGGGVFRIQIAPSFVPALTGRGPDHRELSTKLVTCEIRSFDGGHEVLFPERGSA